MAGRAALTHRFEKIRTNRALTTSFESFIAEQQKNGSQTAKPFFKNRLSIGQHQGIPAVMVPRVTARIVSHEARAFERALHEEAVVSRMHIIQNDESVGAGHFLQDPFQ
jgi:hypothetical protein